MTNPLRVGIVGSGVISAAYLRSKFPQFKIVACSDIREEVATARAKEFDIEAKPVDALLQDSSIEAILNLTIPQSHIPISQAAIDAGKHVYSEKPLGLSREEAEPFVNSAKAEGLRVGCAPDTFLGGAQQTARKLIDDGAIGQPIGGTAFFMNDGPESWHPGPEFFYQKGAGPVLDMGPYYVTSLVNLLGPVKRVHSFGSKPRAKRVIGSGPRKGQKFNVDVLTYVAAILEFHSGPLVNFVFSFDVIGHSHPPIEIYGTKGSVQVPDPNWFGGNVRLTQAVGRWDDVAHTHSFADANYRGIGLADMAAGIASESPHRASGTLAFHVLEVLQAIIERAGGDTTFEIRSTCERPRPLRAIRPIADFT
jgi:predicted dehydrogenase